MFTSPDFNGERGSFDPKLNNVAGEFSSRDLLESILEPRKSISEQYDGAVFTKQHGSGITSRIANIKEATIMV